MNNKSNSSAFKVFITLIIIILVLLSFKLGRASVENTSIVVPKHIGIYTPLDSDKQEIVVVLNKSDKYHVQLSKSITNALNEIETIKMKGGQQ